MEGTAFVSSMMVALFLFIMFKQKPRGYEKGPYAHLGERDADREHSNYKGFEKSKGTSATGVRGKRRELRTIARDQIMLGLVAKFILGDHGKHS